MIPRDLPWHYGIYFLGKQTSQNETAYYQMFSLFLLKGGLTTNQPGIGGKLSQPLLAIDWWIFATHLPTKTHASQIGFHFLEIFVWEVQTTNSEKEIFETITYSCSLNQPHPCRYIRCTPHPPCTKQIL